MPVVVILCGTLRSAVVGRAAVVIFIRGGLPQRKPMPVVVILYVARYVVLLWRGLLLLFLYVAACPRGTRCLLLWRGLLLCRC